MKSTISIIAAVAEYDVIGVDGEIPWHYPEDIEHFRETTMGSPVIMGRTTFDGITDSLGGPLPGRTNIVLTSNPDALYAGEWASNRSEDDPLVIDVDSIENALTTAERYADDTVYVAGGESVYRQFLPLADEMIITTIPEEYDGDRHFPACRSSVWTIDDREYRGDLEIVTYHRT